MTTTSSTKAPLYLTPAPVGVPGAWFDQEAVDRVIRFARNCRHVKGEWRGPIEFEDWQIEHIIAPVFGWKHPDGRRIVQTVWIELPRKNGKSTIATVLGLYLCGADREQGAEVYAAAYDRDQARLVLDPARLMVEGSPALRRKGRFKPFRDNISYRKTGSFFRAVSADYRGKHGYNVHGAIIDEVHVHRTRDLIDALETGTGARRQPLVIFITTAGEEGDTSIYAEKNSYARKVAERVVVDPTFHGVIYAADAADDPHDPKTWEKANPNLGISIKREYLEKKSAEAQASPGALNAFLRFHLNLRTKQMIRWHPLERWDASRGAFAEEDLEGARCYAGLECARSQDINALVLDFPQPDGSHRVLWRFWLPEDWLPALDERTSNMASRWVREGFLTLTPGDVVDYEAIGKQIRDDSKRYDVLELAYNRRGASKLAQELDEEGLDLVEITPGISLAAATQEWERQILAETYHHRGHPVARYQFDGLTMKQNTDGDVWPDKGRSSVNISGCIAALMALDRATRDDGVDLVAAVW